MRRESASSRRRETRAAAPAITDPGLHFGGTAPYSTLAPDLPRRLIDAALLLLADTGVGFEPTSAAQPLFRAAG